jgi:hypothetical protein
MLKGVMLETHSSELNEFIQLERSIHNEMTLNSEPSFNSAQENPIILRQSQSIQPTSSIESRKNGTAAFAQLKSPSVNDLGQSFQAFSKDESLQNTLSSHQKQGRGKDEPILCLETIDILSERNLKQ